MEEKNEGHWAGVDWGDAEHAVCVVGVGGTVRERFKAPHSALGVAEIMARLHKFGELRGVAIETSRHLLVDALWKEGFTVYPVNPKLAHQWRACLSVNVPKDDNRDAWSLAHGLQLYEEQLRPLSPEPAEMHALALLCEQEQKLIAKRTASVCALQAVLKSYFPAVLSWFDSWAAPAAWDFVLNFPTAQCLAATSKQKLCGWFKKRRMRLLPERVERIDTRKNVLALAADTGVSEILSLRAKTLAAELNALERGIKEHRARIETLFEQQPQAALFSSLPGAGPKLAPRLMCIFADCQERYDSARSVCELAGTAPVTRQSGRVTHVFFRRACKKSYRNVMHQFAWTSMRKCPWAKAYYRRCRDKGQKHAQALRNLAIKWTSIIYRMCGENAPYDEQRYIEALRRTNSPLVASIDFKDCG